MSQYIVFGLLLLLLGGLFANDRRHDDHGSSYTPSTAGQCVGG